MQIDRILRTKGPAVHTVPPSATIAEAAALLCEHGIGALVVSSDGETIAGVISERDITRGLCQSGAAAVDLTVADLMTADVATCSIYDTVDALAEVMTARRVRHLPVVEGSRMVGIVSIGDVVKSRLDELQLEAQTLHEYISLGR
jgi:CBS domain-containing protein